MIISDIVLAKRPKPHEAEYNIFEKLSKSLNVDFDINKATLLDFDYDIYKFRTNCEDYLICILGAGEEYLLLLDNEKYVEAKGELYGYVLFNFISDYLKNNYLKIVNLLKEKKDKYKYKEFLDYLNDYILGELLIEKIYTL